MSERLDLDRTNIVRNVLNAWIDWFSGSPQETFANSYSSSISLNQNTQVLFCVFLDIISSITLVSASEISLLVEECSFVDCFRNDNGGAIYFYEGSYCVLSKVCAYQCNTSSAKWGQFCFVRVKSGTAYQSISNLISVCKCSQYENHNGYGSIFLRYGNISLTHINSSDNRCYRCSGVYFYDPLISYITQSTFSNNIDDYFICMEFDYNTHHISQCNIIQNHQKTTSYGTITNDGLSTVVLFNCVIDLNTGAASIIKVYSGSCVVLQNCFLQSNMQTVGNVNTQSPLSDNHSLILSHFNSQMCSTLIQSVFHEENLISSNIKFSNNTNMFNIYLILTLFIAISL